ncbi:MAG TPA: aldehyde dehydrogenase family protein, partial [Stenomitos sp.]
MKSFSMTIDGQLVETNLRFNVVNPATEEVVGNVPVGNASNVDDAVAAAAKAFPAWSSLSDEARSETLNELACLLESNMQELMELVTLETGKPLTGLGGVGSAMEIGGAIAWTRTTAALSLPVDIIQDDETARVEVHRKPLGVVGSITPWNWPLMIAIWHVMPAIRTGNTVIVKPSELAPLATARFVELANQILPKGVLNLVTGPAGS